MDRLTQILEKTLRQITEETGLVGGAISIIKGGKTVYTHTYGYADIDAERKITENSFFDIASCSKAFTTMLAAQACDRGVFSWDEPIRTYIPEFTMTDKYVADHITARDLASHRTGLPTHDFMREKVTGDRRNLVMKTANLPFKYGFRDRYEYNNHMFIILGYLLECVDNGRLWEEQILERIASPLGIEQMRFRGPNVDMTGLDCALPYASNGFKAKRCSYACNNATAPCGGIKVNIKGLCKWISAMSRGGAYGEHQRLCSEKEFQNLITPVIPADDMMHQPEEHGLNYALAWRTSVYNGHRAVHHSGGLTGFNTQVGFFPDDDCGFAMIFNTGSTPAPTVIRALVMDYLTTGDVKDDYSYMIKQWAVKRDATMAQLGRNAEGTPLTSQSDGELMGKYYHPSYTDFDITDRNGRLWFEYGDFCAPLQREKNGVISGYTGTLDGLAADFVEIYPKGNGIDLRTVEDLMIFFEKQK